MYIASCYPFNSALRYSFFCKTITSPCVFCSPNVYVSTISDIKVSIFECKRSSYKSFSKITRISYESYFLRHSAIKSEYSVTCYPIECSRVSYCWYSGDSLFYFGAIEEICSPIKLCLVYYRIVSKCRENHEHIIVKIHMLYCDSCLHSRKDCSYRISCGIIGVYDTSDCE